MKRTTSQNVLLIAYGCEPGRGSEAAIGWSHATATAVERPTWVITHPRHRAALNAGVTSWNRSSSRHPITPIYVDARQAIRRIDELGYVGFNLHYYAWCLAAERAAIEAHARAGFVLAQHVSLSRWWMPSPAAALARRGVPFVWGPVGAGETMPWRFRRGIGVRGHVTEVGRTAARCMFGADPRLGRCARSATLAVAEPAETERRFLALGVREVTRGMSLPCDSGKMAGIVPAAKEAGVFRVVSGGGLVYWKRFDLSIRAFAAAFRDIPDAEYVHVCGGRWHRRLRRLADTLGVGSRVRIICDRPHAENLRWVASADLYVLPAMRDTTAHLFEALSAGVPVLAGDRLSAGAIITSACGEAIDLRRHRTPTAFVDAMAAAMRRWHGDIALRARLSAGARRRADELGEEAFGRHLRRLQARVIAGAAGDAVPAHVPEDARPRVAAAA